MNYNLRNVVMWRWSLVTFFVSLTLTIFGVYTPTMRSWIIPAITPDWLVWPITNTLLVLVIVWLQSNHWALKLLEKKDRCDDYLLTLIQGSIVGFVFCQSYNPFFLVGATILVGSLFSDWLASNNKEHLNNDSILSQALYIYVIWTVIGWNSQVVMPDIPKLIGNFLVFPVLTTLLTYLFVIFLKLIIIFILILSDLLATDLLPVFLPALKKTGLWLWKPEN